jgi:multidrug efflux pump subunit AcrA (membrane-fusion protein)
VTSDSKAASREVALGERRGGAIVVTSGLAPGERIIIAGVHSLAEGQPIKLSEPREEPK